MVSTRFLQDSAANSDSAFNLAVVFAMGIMFLVKAAAHACGFAPPCFGRGLMKRGTGDTSERAWQSPSFGRDATGMSLSMPRLRPPPPAYINPPCYLAPVPKDDMHPKELGVDREVNAPTLEAHASLPQMSIPVA